MNNSITPTQFVFNMPLFQTFLFPILQLCLSQACDQTTKMFAPVNLCIDLTWVNVLLCWCHVQVDSFRLCSLGSFSLPNVIWVINVSGSRVKLHYVQRVDSSLINAYTCSIIVVLCSVGVLLGLAIDLFLKFCLLLTSVPWPAGIWPKHMSIFLALDPMKSDFISESEQ